MQEQVKEGAPTTGEMNMFNFERNNNKSRDLIAQSSMTGGHTLPEEE